MTPWEEEELDIKIPTMWSVGSLVYLLARTCYLVHGCTPVKLPGCTLIFRSNRSCTKDAQLEATLGFSMLLNHVWRIHFKRTGMVHVHQPPALFGPPPPTTWLTVADIFQRSLLPNLLTVLRHKGRANQTPAPAANLCQVSNRRSLAFEANGTGQKAESVSEEAHIRG